ncbi:hypothetical protein Cylst_4152 [Cylindrospermum stagnale PCC 7417]|uniref:Uncharacterized protein n=1 Tax=Cylindrospermum stagnale PCC 7417 TaxID=56107 RepID=K9X2H4_9NOST|nr:hypothetical protein Cylst_4152 [Cylindrospermum stagnale PCC 7417]
MLCSDTLDFFRPDNGRKPPDAPGACIILRLQASSGKSARKIPQSISVIVAVANPGTSPEQLLP